MTGSDGLVGAAVRRRLDPSRWEVVALTRRPRSGAVVWNPLGAWDASPLNGIDAVIHLAGESVAERWTPARKAAIMESRREGTASLCTALAGLERPPAVLVCASAIGIYGDRGDAVLTEDSPPGSGFLADVVRAWEAAAAPARAAGTRVVHLRLGVVLDPEGGALAKMLPPFRLGMGGPVGGGQQYMSWVSIDDAAAAFVYALETPAVEGVYNLVAPAPVTNAEFGAALGRAVHRPAIVPLPAFAVSMMFGEMGREVLLASQRVSSARLAAAGFVFQDRELEGTLERLLDARRDTTSH